MDIQPLYSWAVFLYDPGFGLLIWQNKLHPSNTVMDENQFSQSISVILSMSQMWHHRVQYTNRHDTKPNFTLLASY